MQEENLGNKVDKQRAWEEKERGEVRTEVVKKGIQPVTQDHILWDFIYMKCLQQAHLWRQKVDWWLPRAGRLRGDGG